MWSRRDDATLANPLGPPVRGRSEIDATLDSVASAMRDGETRGFERITEYATPDLAYILEIERRAVKLDGSAEVAAVSLRVTTVWRREDGEWRIALRHADRSRAHVRSSPLASGRPRRPVTDPSLLRIP
jgi:ketosteroid isomerase-like protein